ncbi:anti-sigma factor domain-containing protein [Nesterenkonia cremea]|uniref:Uncharacterized protein n=1 Tax=Nesterenkonia cremea TaxID=1882340 RepID=A0A917AP15_9MICC|nr:anti-sigma factor [Nesterenkonia cremea]GGE64808.1 hypothetical protein GCM10011401_09890 [Nesterenkonia cremea]
METPSPSRRDDQPDEFPKTDAEEPQDSSPVHEGEAEDSDGADAEDYGEEDYAEEGPAEERSEPLTLSELLTGTARGDESSFAAFYEATSDVVYGLALLMHEHPDGAYYSTLAVYQHLWDQADERARDLRLQSATSQSLTEEHLNSPEDEETAYRPSEYELVLEWLVPLAHRIMVERFREGLAEPISLSAVPEPQGGGVAGLPEEILDDLTTLSDAQTQAVALSYLAGGTHQQIADAVDSALPTVKSRLRDSMTRLHAQRDSRETEADPILRAAVTKKDVERSGAVNRNFTNQVSADLEKGLLVELAELYALDAIDDRERALLDETALTADEDTSQQWDTRVLAARRTLSEIFSAHPVVPPGQLLDEILYDLRDREREVGMSMVEEFSSHTEETTKRDPIMTRWMIVTGLVVVILLAILLIWRFTAGQDVEAIADGADDSRTVDDIELAEGGSGYAVISEAEDVAYLDFEDVATLDGHTYQVWLLSADRPPSSLGNFSSSELEEEIVSLRNISSYTHVQITAEEIRGEERPLGDVMAEFPLHEDGPEEPEGTVDDGSEGEAEGEDAQGPDTAEEGA